MRKRTWMLALPLAGAMLMTGCPADPGGGGGGTTTTTAPVDGRPVAVASASPTIGDAPLTVNFSSAGSVLGTGTGATYAWAFGDGGTANTVNATHLYTTVGTYRATLTITTSAGSSTSEVIPVVVNQDPAPKMYVKVGGNNGPSCGPITDPCGDISVGIGKAKAAGYSSVRVAAGDYTGPVSMQSGVAVTGGWSQSFDTQGTFPLTKVTAPDGTLALVFDGVSNAKISGIAFQGGHDDVRPAAVVVSSSTNVAIGSSGGPRTSIAGGSSTFAEALLVGGSSVIVTNTTVNSGTPTGDGQSAYGIRAYGGSDVQLVASEVTAQPGRNGTTPYPLPAWNGANGGNGDRGYNACGPSCNGGGGAPGWGGAGNGGGWGGFGGVYSGWAQNGWDGNRTPEGGPVAGAPGGPGGQQGCGSVFGCDQQGGGGRPGGWAGGGAGGAAGSNAFRSDIVGFAPTHGTNGLTGGHGGGGGGGGGGKSASASGGGGGGGGGGGLAGDVGVAGTSAGGSFGIWAVNSSVKLTSTNVISSAGGVGGNGQQGGGGGNGGNGGGGGFKSCCNAGGGGGGGGGGGAGGSGGGGGGAGGPSVGVVHIGSGTFQTSGSSYTHPVFPAAGGRGGAGGAGGIGGAGGPGADGGWNGDTAGNGAPGGNGVDGPAGQLFRIWDNGVTTA